MKCMRITDGDLDISHSKKVDLVRGRDKLVQDLTLWLLEPLGQGFMTPAFGSTLNSIEARDSVGRNQGRFIGQGMNDRILADIEAEIDRILNLYQQDQIEKIRRARTDGILYMYSRSEILDTIGSITATQDYDRAIVQAFLTSGANSDFNLLAEIDTEETNISAS